MKKPVVPDARYSIQLEYCGYAKRRWIVRFCGEWIGRGLNKVDAESIAHGHVLLRREKF